MKRGTDFLADVPGNHQGHDRIMRNPYIHSQCLGCFFHQCLNLHILLIGNQVRLTHPFTRLHGQHQRINQIVYIQRMIECFTRAEHGESSLVDLFKDHLKALRISRAIDSSRTKNHRFHPFFTILVNQGFGIVFCLLIIVTRLYGSIFITRRIIDITMYPAGGTVDKFFHLMGIGRFKNSPGTADIHLIIIAVRYIQFPECCGKMLYDIYAFHAPVNHCTVRDTSYHHGCSPGTNLISL